MKEPGGNAVTLKAAAGAAAAAIQLTGAIAVVATPFIAVAWAGLLAIMIPDTNEERQTVELARGLRMAWFAGLSYSSAS